MNRLALSFFFLVNAHAVEPLLYAPAPNDTYWGEQWYLENVDTNAVRQGVDMNARAAWALSTGQGVTIAIVDDGVDLLHPDLANKARPELHWNFASDTPDGHHQTHADKHGTPVAGLAVAGLVHVRRQQRRETTVSTG